MQESATQRRLSPIPILIGVAVALVVLLAGHPAATMALSTDELYSLLTAEGSFAEIIANLKAYQPGYFDHPPLFFMLLHLMQTFGNSPLALRLLPMFFGALSAVLLGHMLIRRGWRLGPTLAFLVFFLSHPLILQQTMFVRMYTQVLVLAILAIHILDGYLFRDHQDRRRDVWLVAATAAIIAAMFYTSYFTSLFAVGYFLLCLGFSLRRLQRGDRDGVRRGVFLMAGSILGGILYLPWAPTIWRLVTSESAGEGGIAQLTLDRRFAFLPRYLIEIGGNWLGLLFLVAGWTLLIVYTEHRRRWAATGLMLAILPLLLLTFLTPPTRALVSRYLIYTLPVLWLGAGTGLWLFANRLKLRQYARLWALSIVFLLAAGWNHGIARRTFLAPVPDWWEAAAIIEENAGPREVILTGGFLSGEALVYHIGNPEEFSFHHYVTNIDEFYLECRNPNVVWYVNAAPLPKAYEDILRRYFPYSVTFAGNQGLGPAIMVWSKKSFAMTDGIPAEYREPVPLSYEDGQRLQ